MITWPIAFVLVFVIINATTLTAVWLSHKHKYRMARLEQDSQIVQQFDQEEKEKEETMEM